MDIYIDMNICQEGVDGNRWETLQLKIIDKTERISLME